LLRSIALAISPRANQINFSVAERPRTTLVIKLPETRTGFINKVDWNLIRHLEGLDACKVAPNLVGIANLIQVNEPATNPYSSVTMRNCCGF
jgi:hypothetical protein